MTFLRREEFMAAARRIRDGDEDSGGAMTGTEARDWLVAQAAKGAT